MNKVAWTLLSLFLVAACHTSKNTVSTATAVPTVQREFRAAWIATVANINWPSKPGLSTEQQKKEAIDQLDFLQKNNFNAAVLQVRPQCDALYKSDLEPWSYFLTGQQGKAPDPYYDPLEFWITEAHRRNIELHVWLNPYRAHHKDGKEVTEASVVRRRPELVVYLKEGYWWLDPSLPATRDYSTAVVMDLVKRYDIDGVHFDDYFYPYPSYNGGADFPDSASWNTYQATGGRLSRGDWRRESVNIFIEHLYQEIKKAKPWVKFGLSPFGIWRPGYPESIGGFDQYDQLYADARLWLNKGWIDYFTPQLYWPIGRVSQSFPVLLGWWHRENKKNRHLWPGMSVGRDTSDATVNEAFNQVLIDRGMIPESKGVVFWHISTLLKNEKLNAAIRQKLYDRPALVPASPWLDKKAPRPPAVSLQKQSDSLSVSWTHSDPGDVFHWIAWSQYGGKWRYTILTSSVRQIQFAANAAEGTALLPLTAVAITAVDRTGNESRFDPVPARTP